MKRKTLQTGNIVVVVIAVLALAMAALVFQSGPSPTGAAVSPTGAAVSPTGAAVSPTGAAVSPLTRAPSNLAPSKLFVTAVDAVSLKTPEHGKINYTKKNVSFVCNATGTDLVSISLHLWNVTNKTVAIIAANASGTYAEAIFNYTFARSGIYYWGCFANDSSTSLYSDENRTILIANDTNPGVTLMYPHNAAVLVNKTVAFVYSASSNSSGDLDCYLLLNGSVEYSEAIPQGRSTIYRDLDEGAYDWLVGCYDSSARFGISETRSLNVSYGTDTSPPTVSLLAPDTGTNKLQHYQTIVFNSTDDQGLQNCTVYSDFSGGWQELNGSNEVIINGETAAASVNLGVGNYKWNAKCKDNSGNAAFAPDNSTLNIVENIVCTCNSCGNCTAAFISKDCSEVRPIGDMKPDLGDLSGNCIIKPGQVCGDRSPKLLNGMGYTLTGNASQIYTRYGAGITLGAAKSVIETKNIVFVLDRTGSMSGEKLNDEKIATKKIISAILNDPVVDNYVAIVSYSTTASTNQVLTTNGSLLNASVDALVASGATSIGAGLKQGLSALTGASGSKIIILLSDGLQNTPDTPWPAAADCVQLGIPIIPISFGSDADQKLMKKLGEKTGGKHYHAPTTNQLLEIYTTMLYEKDTVYCGNVQNHSVFGFNITNFKQGIYLINVSMSNVSGVNVSGNNQGLVLSSAIDNRIVDVTADFNYQSPITLDSDSKNNFLHRIVARNNSGSISITSSHNNTLSNVTVSGSDAYGIYLGSSSNNRLFGITSIRSKEINIYLQGGSGNLLTNVTADNTAPTFGLAGIYFAAGANNNVLINVSASNNRHNGVDMRYSHNNSIDGIRTISNTNAGIATDNVNSSTFSGVTAKNNYDGIYLDESQFNTITNVTTTDNTNDGVYVYLSDYNTFRNVTANSNDYDGIRLYLSDGTNILDTATISNTGKGIYPYFSHGSYVNNITTTNNYEGIYAYRSNNSVYSNIRAHSNGDSGIWVEYNSNDTLSYITANNNGWGIYSDYNTLIKIDHATTIGNTYDGVAFYVGTNSSVTDSVSTGNAVGVNIYGGANVTVKSNVIAQNADGIIMDTSNYNLVYDNFFNNTDNYDVIASTNTNWNGSLVSGTNIVGGNLLGGNFWANPSGTGFSETCTDTTPENGICDSSYTLASADYHPLTFTTQSEVTFLTIWDENDAGMPYGGFSRVAGENVVFYANFTNTSSLPANATTGACQVDFADPAYDGYAAMTWDAGIKLHKFTTSFASANTYDWKVNCTGQGENLEANDTIIIGAAGPSPPAPVPEFGTWALLIALGLVAGGIVSMRGGSMGLRGSMRSKGSAKRTK